MKMEEKDEKKMKQLRNFIEVLYGKM